MLYKIITKREFKKFINGLISENEAIGPKKVATDAKGKPIYQFKQVHSFDEIDLDYTVSYSSLKNFFLPFKEELSTFSFKNGDWEQNIKYHVNPRVIIGVRPCDINGLNELDNIFVNGKFPSPYYLARRMNTFLIGLDHIPPADCFCESFDAHQVNLGFHLFCSDAGDKYHLAINSSKAFNFLKNVNTREPTEKDNKAYIERKKLIKKKFRTKVNTAGLYHYLDLEFKSPIWKKWGDRCLNCGTCAMVCPTCYCFGIEENIDVSLKKSQKERIQYSCNIVDFAEVAGGHNFRPLREDRLKYRYYHHYKGFAENANEQICVGCNRCGRACLAGINPKDVINDLRLESTDEL